MPVSPSAQAEQSLAALTMMNAHLRHSVSMGSALLARRGAAARLDRVLSEQGPLIQQWADVQVGQPADGGGRHASVTYTGCPGVAFLTVENKKIPLFKLGFDAAFFPYML